MATQRRCSAKGLRIREVLQSLGVASGLKLVGDKVSRGYKICRQSGCIIDGVNRAAAPCIVEGYARDVGENIDTEWWVAANKIFVAFGQFVWTYIVNRHTKLCPRQPYDFAIRSVRSNENIEVFGRARLGVNTDRITPDDKIPRAFSV